MSFDLTARIEAWRTQLLDTTRRNRLINFKTGRGGGVLLLRPDPGDLWDRLVGGTPLTFPWRRDLLDLPELPPPAPDDSLTLPIVEDETPEPPAAPDELKRCLESPRLGEDHLLTDLPDEKLRQRLTRLALNARESLSEQGVATLYVVFGFLRWFESPDSEVEVRSPLLLVPVKLERDSIESPWRLRAADDDLLPNHSLAQLLLEDFKLRLPVFDESAHTDEKSWRTDYLGEVQKAIRELPRWEVLDDVALGMFSFQKLAMW
ncbi:MAG TPA: DUF4011 domain-containing protein, partial [Gemmataceae bacterium]|nr:DUF4011 domain-containing protein [Gemmataceae bacterium]